MKRGFTLIELMISVALLSISAVIAGNEALELRKRGAEHLQYERALQVLESEADAMVHAVPADPLVRMKLLADLPEGHLDIDPDGPERTHLTVKWRSPRGDRQRSLLVYGRPR